MLCGGSETLPRVCGVCSTVFVYGVCVGEMVVLIFHFVFVHFNFYLRTFGNWRRHKHNLCSFGSFLVTSKRVHRDTEKAVTKTMNVCCDTMEWGGTLRNDNISASFEFL